MQSGELVFTGEFKPTWRPRHREPFVRGWQSVRIRNRSLPAFCQLIAASSDVTRRTSLKCYKSKTDINLGDYNPFISRSQLSSVSLILTSVRKKTTLNHISKISHISLVLFDIKIWSETHNVHTRPGEFVFTNLKACIVQTINSAYKGIFILYTDKVSV